MICCVYTGECCCSDLQEALKAAVIEQKLPKLKHVRRSICHALQSSQPELVMATSALSKSMAAETLVIRARELLCANLKVSVGTMRAIISAIFS
jgi:hypothetical protein